LKLTPKTKKMKLLAILLFLLPLCVVILGAGCEEDEEIVELSEKGFLKFSDFGCENIVWNFKAGNSNSYYTVNSQQELSNYINSDCNPQIDFNKYFVIIGSKSFPTGFLYLTKKWRKTIKKLFIQ
jgi:hypothetical protein